MSTSLTIDQSYPESEANFKINQLIEGDVIEVMRISKSGITVNPLVPMDDAAKYVISALDTEIKRAVKQGIDDYVAEALSKGNLLNQIVTILPRP